MDGASEDPSHRPFLDHPAEIHHRDRIGHLGDDAEVMGDQHQGHADIVLQLPEQIENLGLDRHIERRRRFVGDDQLRPARQRHGDHHPLVHAARKLVGVFLDPPIRIGDADPVEKGHRFPGRLVMGHALVQLQAFGQLPADLVHRVERGQRVLEDHGDVTPAHLPHGALIEGEKVNAGEQDFAADHPAVRRRQLQDRVAGHGFAAAALADEAEGLALIDVQIDAVDGGDQAFFGLELDLEVADF